MGFNDGRISHEGAAIIAHCRGWEVLTLMKPEAIAAVQSLQNNFKQFYSKVTVHICVSVNQLVSE